MKKQICCDGFPRIECAALLAALSALAQEQTEAARRVADAAVESCELEVVASGADSKSSSTRSSLSVSPQ